MIEHANQSLRSKSGSLAMFAALRFASSFFRNFAADCPLLLLWLKEAAYLGGRQWNGSSRKHR